MKETIITMCGMVKECVDIAMVLFTRENGRMARWKARA
jgi:hypothetical protein